MPLRWRHILIVSLFLIVVQRYLILILIVSHFSFIKRHDICIDYFSFKNYATEKEDEDISLRITPDVFSYDVSEDEILN